jgi:integrase
VHLGYNTTQKRGVPSVITFISQLYKFLFDFFDERTEFEKDIWDFKKIAGARITNTNAQHTINFENTPEVFRPMVKRYMKYRLTMNSILTCAGHLQKVSTFLNFIHQRYPEWKNLKSLNRQDMEEYFLWFKDFSKGWGETRNKYVKRLIDFFEHVQREGYPEAPNTPYTELVYKSDIPRRPKISSNENIKFIPQNVLEQFENHIEYLDPKYQLIAIVLRASGWRICDICELRYHFCLDQTPEGWYLRGDIPKTSIFNHRIPISDEVAVAVMTYAEDVQQISTNENNPKHLLFNTFSGKRMGECPTGDSVKYAFNKLANKYNITTDDGQIFHFNNHSFRHTRAVEFINNGMPLYVVQKWMAHQSPRTTLRYAEILSETLRKSWEEVMSSEIYRFDIDGSIIPLNPNDEYDANLIEWEYIRFNLDAVKMPLGFCMKPSNSECCTQLNPCLTCKSLCTTTDFIPQYKQEIIETKMLIDKSKELGRDIWVEKNEAYLHKLEKILEILEQGRANNYLGRG